MSEFETEREKGRKERERDRKKGERERKEKERERVFLSLKMNPIMKIKFIPSN